MDRQQGVLSLEGLASAERGILRVFGGVVARFGGSGFEKIRRGDRHGIGEDGRPGLRRRHGVAPEGRRERLPDLKVLRRVHLLAQDGVGLAFDRQADAKHPFRRRQEEAVAGVAPHGEDLGQGSVAVMVWHELGPGDDHQRPAAPGYELGDGFLGLGREHARRHVAQDDHVELVPLLLVLGQGGGLA